MNIITKQILHAAIIATILAITGVIVEMRTAYIDLFSISILIPSFLLITVTSLIIFNAGSSKPDDTQPLYTLSAIGSKFLLAAVLALVYFVAFKKYEARFVLLFFILYLSFTFYLLFVIFKALKNRPLKRNKI